MKVLMSWSSGKDSAWALHALRRDGVDVAGLLTSLNETVGRVSMHGVREDVLRAQAGAAGLPLFTIPLPWPCTNDIYEARLRVAVDRAVAGGFTHVAFGDLFLEDVRTYREDRLAGTGLTPLFPLWGIPTARLAREMIAGGLRARVSTLDPRVMPRDLIGAEFDESLLARLPPGVDPCAERGEFHTCVTAGPMFATPLDLERGEVVEREGFVYGDLILGRADSCDRSAPAVVPSARLGHPLPVASWRRRPACSLSRVPSPRRRFRVCVPLLPVPVCVPSYSPVVSVRLLMLAELWSNTGDEPHDARRLPMGSQASDS